MSIPSHHKRGVVYLPRTPNMSGAPCRVFVAQPPRYTHVTLNTGLVSDLVETRNTYIQPLRTLQGPMMHARASIFLHDERVCISVRAFQSTNCGRT